VSRFTSSYNIPVEVEWVGRGSVLHCKRLNVLNILLCTTYCKGQWEDCNSNERKQLHATDAAMQRASLDTVGARVEVWDTRFTSKMQKGAGAKKAVSPDFNFNFNFP
jgi:hypothetical protein